MNNVTRFNIERLVREKNALGFFSRRVFCFNIVTLGKGSKYREFCDLLGRITCMTYLNQTLYESFQVQ